MSNMQDGPGTYIKDSVILIENGIGCIYIRLFGLIRRFCLFMALSQP